VSFSVQLGLLLALATAFTSVIGFLYKARGAQEAPQVDWKRPVYSTFVLFRSGWYSVGIAVALGGWFLHVGALALAPISLVQTVIAGGLVLLTVAADKLFGQRVTKREWIGVGLTAAGLAFLAATMSGGADDAHSDYTTSTLLIFVGALSLAGVVAALVAARRGGFAVASCFALSAGLLWAASDTSIKALSNQLDNEGVLHAALHPLSIIVFLASFVGLLVSAKSLQLGDAVPVIAVTSAAANLCTIAAGPIVFGEPMPNDAFGLTVRLVAFALVVVAAALTPPPASAAEPPGDAATNATAAV
jgi:multidrug transporter EmrE-like cation transporter